MQRGGASAAVEKIEQASSAKIFSGTARRRGQIRRGYLWSASVRSTDLDFSPQKNLNPYPAQLSVKGVCQGGSSVPLDRVLPTFARTKVGPRRVGVLTKPCKRPRDADRRLQIWSKISFTAFHGRKAGPAGRRILLCGEGRAQAGEGDLREVVAGLAESAIQVHAVNGDLLPAGQGAKGGAALQVIQKG